MTLLIVACLLGTDNCNWAIVADGFANEKQCLTYSQVMIDGWKAEHGQLEVRRGLCTESANYLMNRFKA